MKMKRPSYYVTSYILCHIIIHTDQPDEVETALIVRNIVQLVHCNDELERVCVCMRERARAHERASERASERERVSEGEREREG